MVREKETFSKDSFSPPPHILSKNAPRCRTPSSAVAGGATACPAAAAEAGTAEEKERVARHPPCRNSCPSSVHEAQLFSAVMSALTASPPVCDIAERPHGRRRKKVLPLLVTMNRSNRQPGSTRAPAGSPPPVRFPSSGYGALLSPPSAGSHLRAPLCSTVFPRLPASRLRPAPAPPVSVMRRPGLAVLRKRRRRRPAPSCPFPSITARMPPFPSATLGLVFRLPTARPPRRAVLFLFRPQRRKHFCRFRSKALLFSFIINMLLIASAKNSPFFRKTPLPLRQQKRKTFLL